MRLGLGLGLGGISGNAGGGSVVDPAIGVPVLSLGVAQDFYPISLNTPLPIEWQADVTSVHFQASTVADADAGWLSPSIDDTHLITNAEATAAAWSVPNLSSIVSPAVTILRARAEEGGAFGAWSNELIHGDVAQPVLGSSLTPAARSELVDSIVYVATFDEKVTITGFGGADAALLVAENANVAATSHNIRRLDAALTNYASKTSYGFTITAKDRANNSVTTATITAAVKDEVPTGFVNAFTDVTGAAASTLYTAPETYTVAGLTAGVFQPLTITGGEYRLNTGSGWGAWTTAAASVQNGDQIQRRGFSSGLDGGVVNLDTNIAGTVETFRITNVNTFNPASLFGPSDDGYLYVISPTTCFTDTARTTTASVGQAVKGITDLSGKGRHLAWVSGGTLTLRQVGAFYYLEAAAGVGVTQVSVPMAQPWSRISALRITAWTVNARILGETSVTKGSLVQLASTPTVKVDDNGAGSQPAINPTLNTDITVSELHNNASSTVQLDNGTPQTGTSGAETCGGLTLFNRSAGDRSGQGWLYGTIGINRDLTPTEEASCRTYFAGLYGGSL